MKDKIDLEILQETLIDLRNNAEACTILGGAKTEDVAFSIAESKPGEKLNDFIHYLYNNNLLDANYIENNCKIKDKQIAEMSVEEILTRITWIIRGDRFNSGLIYSCFKDGTLLKLVEKLSELIS